jgi:hypothetical protein
MSVSPQIFRANLPGEEDHRLAREGLSPSWCCGGELPNPMDGFEPSVPMFQVIMGCDCFNRMRPALKAPWVPRPDYSFLVDKDTGSVGIRPGF